MAITVSSSNSGIVNNNYLVNEDELSRFFTEAVITAKPTQYKDKLGISQSKGDYVLAITITELVNSNVDVVNTIITSIINKKKKTTPHLWLKQIQSALTMIDVNKI